MMIKREDGDVGKGPKISEGIREISEEERGY